MEYIILSLGIINIVLLIFLLSKSKSGDNSELRNDIKAEQTALRQELSQTVQSSVKTLGDFLSTSQKEAAISQEKQLAAMEKSLSEKQEALNKSVVQSLSTQEGRFKTFSLENEQKLDNIRTAVEKKLSYIQEDNNKKLDEMRKIVDEKLQQTLEDRMTKSFMLVNERLEQVYKGLGEMQTLAVGVGDLKKVLSNVKTRGVLGEIQLGAILEEIMAPEQYQANIATVSGSRNVVEYAIKIPTDDDGFIYLPIDSKFPADAYTQLLDAYDAGSPELVQAAVNVLKARIRSFAKDIRDKYINPPETTEFAIMFLPFEGLYAEVVNRGMVEILQREFRVNIAGPSTMAALLNSLQMGFRTVAIQKRSGEVWNVLEAVKTEFDKFGSVLVATQQRIEQANAELDKLVGVRTRQIQRKLKNVATLSEQNVKLILPDSETEYIEESETSE